MTDVNEGATTLVWYESDLRMADHPALEAAARRGGAVVPVFIWDGGAGWAEGTASRWWLHHSLLALAESLRERGLDLVIRRGDPGRELEDLARTLGADRVTWNARTEPDRATRDRRIADSLRRSGVECVIERGSLLHDPERIRTTSGGPYRVFTAFYRRLADTEPGAPVPVPPLGKRHGRWPRPAGLVPGELDLLPGPDEADAYAAAWSPGEDGAHRRLGTFLDHAAARYPDTRNMPATEGTSRLSPHLHFGEITPAQIRHRLTAAHGESGSDDVFLRQLGWREFAFHLLHHYPDTPHQPLRPDFKDFPWRSDSEGLEKWKRGETGYPLVDAGMRELWTTGWMHNRVRMVTASFLTKHLLVSWKEGAAWFRERLVDADLANNTLGWQWSAGCGADAQPFFRIFNPEKQGRRFDPDGAYILRWVPELGGLGRGALHAPWTGMETDRTRAGAGHGGSYPPPIVKHVEARHRALDAWQTIRAEQTSVAVADRTR